MYSIHAFACSATFSRGMNRMATLRRVVSICLLLLAGAIQPARGQTKPPKDVQLQLDANQPDTIVATILPSNQGSSFTSYNVTYWSTSLGHANKVSGWIDNTAQQITCASNRLSGTYTCGNALNAASVKFWTNKFPTQAEPEHTQDFITFDLKELVTLERIKFGCNINYGAGR